MTEQATFTLTEIARRLNAEQHRLIHLCEKGVVQPDLQDAAGRGTSRIFSPRNFLEFSIALRLRDMMLPVAPIRAIVYVLRAFETALQRERRSFSLPDSLRTRGSPDLRIIVSDGDAIYFSLSQAGKKPKLFGRVSLDRLVEDEAASVRGVARPATADRSAGTFGGPEGSRYARLEVSVTQIARDLPLD